MALAFQGQFSQSSRPKRVRPVSRVLSVQVPSSCCLGGGRVNWSMPSKETITKPGASSWPLGFAFQARNERETDESMLRMEQESNRSGSQEQGSPFSQMEMRKEVLSG